MVRQQAAARQAAARRRAQAKAVLRPPAPKAVLRPRGKAQPAPPVLQPAPKRAQAPPIIIPEQMQPQGPVQQPQLSLAQGIPDTGLATPNQLPTPLSIRNQNAPNLLHRIKLELFTGEGDITPWIGKVRTLTGIHGLEEDAAKISYIHLHLAGKALAWFNDQGCAKFPTFDHLEAALVKQYGVSEAKRQKIRTVLITMEQKESTVQDITDKFESSWRLAYPNEHNDDATYKLHNYLRVLNTNISSMVGMQNPRTFEAAKELAINVEAHLPRHPMARINTVTSGDTDFKKEQEYLHQLVATSTQQQEALVHQAVTAITESLHQDKARRQQELEEMRRVLNRNQPPPPRTNGYERRHQDYQSPTRTGPSYGTGGNRQPLMSF